MALYLHDPCDGYTKYDNLDEALREARHLIDAARDECDPEWPSYVEDIVIYESDDDDEPNEGRIVARPVECDRIEMPDDLDEDGYSESLSLYFDSVEFYCDYKMEAV